ncbi:hypothetical protein Scep_009877 [Stephania cephalantha]|uniref:Uncharacterized protein n=1 Tax=Stephania cephalantha TaxID=152367 RepID=A0AAP0JTY1_9MAGN
MDWGFVHRTWERWVFPNLGSSGEQLKGSFLLNYDPTGLSRFLYGGSIGAASRAMAAIDQLAWQLSEQIFSLISIEEQRGIKLKLVELSPFLDFIKKNNFNGECFFIGPGHCEWSLQLMRLGLAHDVRIRQNLASEGAIVMQTAAAFILVALESVMKVPISGVNVTTPDQALTLLAAVAVDCPRCPVKYVMRLQMMP